MVCLALELAGPCVVLGFSVSMEVLIAKARTGMLFCDSDSKHACYLINLPVASTKGGRIQETHLLEVQRS